MPIRDAKRRGEGWLAGFAYTSPTAAFAVPALTGRWPLASGDGIMLVVERDDPPEG
jgi:hypothetical protein